MSIFWSGCLLLRQQQYRQDLVHASKSTGVDLAHIDCFCLQQLLEHHTVLAVLSCCNAHTIRFESRSNRCVSENVVWRGRLFEETARTGQQKTCLRMGIMTYYGLNSTSCCIHSIASGTFHT